MTDIRVGDIVKIETGDEGTPGYRCTVSRVTKAHTYGPEYVSLALLQEFRSEDGRVTVIERAPKYRTALVKYDGELVPVLVNRGGMLTLPTGDTIFRKGIDEDSFIETCPYVPMSLIKMADAWEAGDPEWFAGKILGAIVNAVREYRDGTP